MGCVKTSAMMVNSRGEIGQPCLVPELTGTSPEFSLLTLIVTLELS